MLANGKYTRFSGCEKSSHAFAKFFPGFEGRIRPSQPFSSSMFFVHEKKFVFDFNDEHSAFSLFSGSNSDKNGLGMCPASILYNVFVERGKIFRG